MPLHPTLLTERAARLRLILLDVDGVLTDGSVLVHADGSESKRFAIRDGAALVWAQRAGLRVGLISGRASDATARRAAELGITLVAQGMPDKREAYARMLAEAGCRDEDVAFMGDDLLDLAVLARAGFSAAPADADPEVTARVDWVGRRPGGHGAVRELIEFILRAQGRWDNLVQSHLD